MIGQSLGHYKILEKLGEGGMGEVYQAEDTELRRRVALKVLPPEMATDPERLERFKREARTVAALNHPNIVTIYSVESAADLHFLTMELVEGQTLGQLIPSSGLKLDQLFDIAIPLADALVAAHESGITHRDLKPGNIMITDDGRVKVLDFGLAKVHDLEPEADATYMATEAITEDGRVLGTVPYMSPEQVEGKTLDPRSDIFSMGIILYEMATGNRPFAGDSSAALMSAILKESPSSVTVLKADLPRQLARIIAHCLEKNPERRFQTAKDLRNEFQSLSREIETGEILESSASVVSAVEPVRARSRLPILAGIGVVVLAVLAVTGFLLLRSDKEAAPGAAERVATPTAATNGRTMIAVLPFENLGPAEDEYFADGLTEEITSRLAVMSGLGVISRTSAMQYKENRPPLKQIGEELGVDYLLEGTVRWERPGEGPSRIRVTPQLIRVADDTHLWASRYDRELEEIFAVQSNIAEEVARELNVTLLEPERQALEERPTDNMEAYQAYLRGMDLWLEPGWDPPRFEVSAQMLERAVELDPGFVLPWAQLVSIHGILYAYYDPTTSRLEQSKRALDRALAIDPRHPEVRLAEGYYLYYGLTDYAGALEIFEAVEKERPNDSEVQQSIAWINRRLGRMDAALDRLHQALAIDPQNAHVNFHIGVTSAALRRFAEADPYFDRAIALAPDTIDMYRTKAEALVSWTGETTRAREVLARGPGNEELTAVWVDFDLRDRDFEGALATLDAAGMSSIEHSDRRAYLHLLTGFTHEALGDADRARQSFEAARLTAAEALEQAPRASLIRATSASALAALGRQEEAVQEASVAVEETAADRFAGPLFEEVLAWVYSRGGEEERAIDLLEELLATPYQEAITIRDLQHHPNWDPLRDHPRFQALLENHGLE